MKTRLCNHCNLEKEINLFETTKQCKKCRNKKRNTPEQKERRKLYRQKNREKLRIGRNRWAKRNRERDNGYKQKWRANNKNKEYEYQKNRRKTNVGYRIAQNLRHRVWLALEGGVKSKPTKKMLGCSIDEFKIYLESRFIEGMTWDNYGENGWHVGHILPCRLFDLSNPKEQEICFNYKNLKPQWGTENSTENDKLPDGRMARSLSKEGKIEYLKSIGINL